MIQYEAWAKQPVSLAWHKDWKQEESRETGSVQGYHNLSVLSLIFVLIKLITLFEKYNKNLAFQ